MVCYVLLTCCCGCYYNMKGTEVPNPQRSSACDCTCVLTRNWSLSHDSLMLAMCIVLFLPMQRPYDYVIHVALIAAFARSRVSLISNLLFTECNLVVRCILPSRGDILHSLYTPIVALTLWWLGRAWANPILVSWIVIFHIYTCIYCMNEWINAIFTPHHNGSRPHLAHERDHTKTKQNKTK